MIEKITSLLYAIGGICFFIIIATIIILLLIISFTIALGIAFIFNLITTTI